jgi:hypothetical protein
MTDDYTVREAVAVFHNGAKMEAAIDDLMKAGFTREQINVMASHESVVEKLNHRFEPMEQMEDDPRIPQGVFVAKDDRVAAEAVVFGVPLYIGATVGGLAVVASGGGLALAIAAAAAGGLAGGGLGGIAAHAIGNHHAKAIEEHVKAGGLLLWVRIDDPSQEKVAIDLMKANNGEYVHAHDITRTWDENDVPLHDFQPDPLLEKD